MDIRLWKQIANVAEKRNPGEKDIIRRCHPNQQPGLDLLARERIRLRVEQQARERLANTAALSPEKHPSPVPDFQVTELDDGSFKIQGTFNTTEYETSRQEVKFKLNHICPGLFSFHLSRTSYQSNQLGADCETSSSNFEVMVELSLETMTCFPSSSPLVCCEDSHRRPTAVWASINASPTFFLKPISPGQWKSAKMPFGSHRFELKQTKIPCVLYINFSRTCGEMNAQMQFINLYVNQFNCDVTFHFDTAKKDESIGGHVTILSVRSSVFAAMFQSGMQETNTRKVCIKDIKPDIFKQLLHYIYSGRTSTKLSEEIAQPLYVAADMYDIEDLKDECVQFLLCCIKLENAINLMAWAHVHSIDSIKEATLTFVESRGREICKQDDWERLIKNYPDLSLLASRRMLK
uniref:Btb/poz domain-containing protein n=1 Tax=Daphnia magna TaxID=35525 RepID=A0A0P6F4L0_9CRUS